MAATNFHSQGGKIQSDVRELTASFLRRRGCSSANIFLLKCPVLAGSTTHGEALPLLERSSELLHANLRRLREDFKNSLPALICLRFINFEPD
jgi:hypothetical protein